MLYTGRLYPFPRLLHVLESECGTEHLGIDSKNVYKFISGIFTFIGPTLHLAPGIILISIE